MKRRVATGGKATTRGPGKSRAPGAASRRAGRPASVVAGLEKQLSEALQHQSATSEVLDIIGASQGELKLVFQAILRNAIRLCDAKFGNLLLIDGQRVRWAAGVGTPRKLAQFLQAPSFQPTPGSHLERVLRTRQVSHSIDDTAEPVIGASARLGGARSTLCVPMVKGKSLVGAIFMYRTEVRPFTDAQVNLVKSFAAQAVIAIENVRLFNETQEALERQTATADILKVIASSPDDVQPVFDAIAKWSNRLLGGHATAAYRYAEGMIQLAAFTPVSPDADASLKAAFPRPILGSPQVEVARDGSIVQITDSEAEGVSQFSRDLARLRGWRSALFVPLKTEEGPIGSIGVTRKEPGPFAKHHIELLKTFADQAVIAIENVRLFEEVQARTRDLTESLQFQTASSDVLRVISRSPDALQPVLDVIVETSRELCGSSAATIFLEREGKFHVAALSGALPDRRSLMFVRANPILLNQRGSVLARAARLKRTIHVPNTADDPEFDQGGPIGVGGPRAVLAVPLMQNGQVIGGIVLPRSHTNPFTTRQIEAIETFADQAVIAISNVTLFEQVQARTRELTQSLDDLRAAQDRLVQTEKLASLGQLTAGIAHEIKNPLNFVNNFAGLSAELIGELRDAVSDLSVNPDTQADIKELTDMLSANLEKIVQHGKRADAIVKSMLLHSAQGSGEHRLSDINALVDECLNRAYYGERAETRGFTIKLEKSFDAAVGEVDLFPREISRALLNLILNGFYATTKRQETEGSNHEPVLLAATRNLGDRVEIRIRDNGSGIPADVKERMFDPFFTTKPPGEGTGLGLSITHDIVVKQHGGSIEVDTKLGEFTEVRVILPRLGALLPERQ